MANPEEKFFAEVPKDRTVGGDYEIELAKANAVAAKKSAAVKKTEENPVAEPEGQLAIDVYQTPSEIVVESAVAGVKPEDLDVTATADSLTIRGERRREREVKEDDYLYQECYWGRFSRSIILPQEVDPDGAAVTFKNGILTVHLPKRSRERSKKLKVKVE